MNKLETKFDGVVGGGSPVRFWKSDYTMILVTLICLLAIAAFLMLNGADAIQVADGVVGG